MSLNSLPHTKIVLYLTLPHNPEMTEREREGGRHQFIALKTWTTPLPQTPGDAVLPTPSSTDSRLRPRPSATDTDTDTRDAGRGADGGSGAVEPGRAVDGEGQSLRGRRLLCKGSLHDSG